MIHIEFEFKDKTISAQWIERAAQAVLAHQSTDGDLTIVLTDDARLQTLNRDYLGIDAPTDVLSFPASETDPETGARYLGDILISIPRADAQAKVAGHPLESEVQLLVVHGVLHLLGFDHAEAEEKTKMWKAQAEVLEQLGLSGIEIQKILTTYVELYSFPLSFVRPCLSRFMVRLANTAKCLDPCARCDPCISPCMVASIACAPLGDIDPYHRDGLHG